MPFGMSVEFRTLTSPTFMLLMSLSLTTGGGIMSPPLPPHATARITTAGKNLFITRDSWGRVRREFRINTREAGKGACLAVQQSKAQPARESWEIWRLAAIRARATAFACSRSRLYID